MMRGSQAGTPHQLATYLSPPIIIKEKSSTHLAHPTNLQPGQNPTLAIDLVLSDRSMEEEQQQPSWEEILGSRNWEGLLDPLSLELRRLILKCGDLIQVTYDTFINDNNSKYCGCSRYGKKSLLHKVLFPDADDYDVVSFLYATARVSVPEAFLMKSQSRERWDRESNWIGYVAVSNDRVTAELGRREIYVVWRGTTRNYEWIDVLGADLESAQELLRADNNELSTTEEDDDDDDGVPKVMRGWLTIYVSNDPKSPFTKTSVRTQLLAILTHLIQRYKEEDVSITLTGHSLGASLSIVSAFDIVENLSQSIPVCAIVFGCPKVGNKNFNQRFNSYSNLKALQVKNVIDLIPHYPTRIMGYVNTGTDLLIDTRKSPYLKDSKNPSDWHNLQAMVHIVDGWNGKDGKFEERIKRSLALVNKSCDFLKDECMVPASWWIVKNKGMVLKDGDWVMGELDEEDLPVPPEFPGDSS